MNELDILKEKLKGSFYCRFSVGDTWDFYFNGFWLTANEVIFDDEKILNEYLFDNFQPALEAIDNEDISKSTIVASCLRKNIIDVYLNPDSSLKLTFENGVQMKFPSNTEIVDWQWAINHNCKDPHIDLIVGCFGEGDVKIGSC